MRMSNFIASTLLATVIGSGAAFAGPYNPFGTMGGQARTTESSYESQVTQPGDTLNGIFQVTTIADLSGNTYVPGLVASPPYISGVFSGFVLSQVTNLNGQFQLYFTGGALNYYAQTTNPWTNPTLNTLVGGANTPANQAAAIAYLSGVQATNILSLAPQVISNAGPNHPILFPNITLEIDITSGNLNNVLGASTQEVYLDIVGGTLASQFAIDTFLNKFTNGLADAVYQGSAANDQCLNGQPEWPICGTNHLKVDVIPEPVTLSLFGAGLAGAAALRRRKAKKA